LVVPSRYAPLLDFTDFAVAFRYDAFPDLEADTDRGDCTAKVHDLVEHVRSIFAHQRP
jgi:hypothetical protein